MHPIHSTFGSRQGFSGSAEEEFESAVGAWRRLGLAVRVMVRDRV